MLKKVGYRPYRPILVQALNENDKPSRIAFANWWADTLNRIPELPYFVLWSDESIFRLNGVVNRHNSVYYALENPNNNWSCNAISRRFCLGRIVVRGHYQTLLFWRHSGRSVISECWRLIWSLNWKGNYLLTQYTFNRTGHQHTSAWQQETFFWQNSQTVSSAGVKPFYSLLALVI